MSRTPCFRTAFLTGVGLLVALSVLPRTSQAVPSFARQTGLPCSTCHNVFPELTAFGRDFKMNGYVMTGLQQVESTSKGSTSGLKINEIPPLSAMLQVSMTRTSKAQPDVQNSNVEFPHQLSFFFAGEVSEHMGSFLQFTYTQEDGHFSLDNTDLRYANHIQFAGADTIYGVTINNNPTVEDVWNSTPAWGYPWSNTSSAPTPSAGALVNGALGGDVAGIGGYTFWNQHLYAGVTLYRSAHVGQLAPDATSANTIKGLAPYWRLAWQQPVGDGNLEIGTYGMTASLYPGDGSTAGISGPTDKFTDTALDMQYERPLGDNSLTLHGTYIHEKRTLDASSQSAWILSNASDTLKTLKLDGTYHFGSAAALSLGYFKTTGSADTNYYNPGDPTTSPVTPAPVINPLTGSANGKPDSDGWIGQVSYLPWQNTKLSLQYTAYNKFNGASSNYDGAGRSASDNNTLYLEGWFVW